jgi:uncharacterized protein (TIGR01777 family)
MSGPLTGKRVVVSGATGLIGQALLAALKKEGAVPVVLSRDPQRARQRLGEVEALLWEEGGSPPEQAFAGAAAVVHLSGESIDQRWTATAKERIRNSRVQTTQRLVDRLSRLQEPPGVFLCASAIGYYGDRGPEPLDEEAPPGDGFLPEVCKAWEQEAAKAADLGIRTVSVRTGVVLAKEGGALARMLPFFRAGLGGPVGSGRQYLSWIHLDDVVGLYLHALGNDGLSGPLNATAPQPVTNAEFSRTLGRVLHRPAFLPVPPLALRLLYGEMATLLTSGARVVPAKALIHGYTFRFPDLQQALEATLGR